MGLYPDRGLEYRVYTDDNNYKIIIPLKQLDNRLEKSNYYQSKKDEWLRNFKQGVNCKVPVKEISDIILTNNEEILIKKNTTITTTECIKEHGFYDVTYVGCTL